MNRILRAPLAVFLVCVLAAGVSLAETPASRVLRVGASQAYKTPSAAAAVAQDGDTVEIDAGDFSGDVARWTASNLTIRGAGGVARLKAAGRSCQGKAIWVISGNHTTVEHIDFSGCHVPDHNGAGIRLEGAGLTLRACRFHDNENGLLTGASPASDILIESTEFDTNGAGDGQSHNLYVGRVRSLTMRFCSSHGARAGHLVKSRAESSFLLCNQLMDEQDGTSSYLVDFPDGGRCFLVGNILQHGPSAQNRVAVSFAEESDNNTAQELWVINNTYVNQRAAGSDFLRAGGSRPYIRAVNNLAVHVANFLNEAAGELSHNLITDEPDFVDEAHYDYHLRPSSPAVGAGIDPGKFGSLVLLPQFQHRHPLDKEERPKAPRVDIGAYQSADVRR